MSKDDRSGTDPDLLRIPDTSHSLREYRALAGLLDSLSPLQRHALHLASILRTGGQVFYEHLKNNKWSIYFFNPIPFSVPPGTGYTVMLGTGLWYALGLTRTARERRQRIIDQIRDPVDEPDEIRPYRHYLRADPATGEVRLDMRGLARDFGRAARGNVGALCRDVLKEPVVRKIIPEGSWLHTRLDSVFTRVAGAIPRSPDQTGKSANPSPKNQIIKVEGMISGDTAEGAVTAFRQTEPVAKTGTQSPHMPQSALAYGPFNGSVAP